MNSPVASAKNTSQHSKVKGGRCSQARGLWVARAQVQPGRDRWLVLSNSTHGLCKRQSTDVMAVWTQGKENPFDVHRALLLPQLLRLLALIASNHPPVVGASHPNPQAAAAEGQLLGLRRVHLHPSGNLGARF